MTNKNKQRLNRLAIEPLNFVLKAFYSSLSPVLVNPKINRISFDVKLNSGQQYNASYFQQDTSGCFFKKMAGHFFLL
jgi:hypothetical protein